jgi:hypothetical protein
METAFASEPLKAPSIAGVTSVKGVSAVEVETMVVRRELVLWVGVVGSVIRAVAQSWRVLD